MMLGDKLFKAPIGDDPQRVLDVGTGTGIWAMQVHPPSTPPIFYGVV
jgi:ubiquinone/menaquinone biosynthesis C-methylase UbiE